MCAVSSIFETIMNCSKDCGQVERVLASHILYRPVAGGGGGGGVGGVPPPPSGINDIHNFNCT